MCFVFGGLVAALLVGTIVQITFNAPHFSQAEIQRIATEGQTGFRSFAQDSYDSAKLPGALLLAAALVLVPLALLLPSSKRNRRLLAGAGSAAVVAVILVLGWHQSRDYVRDRYDTTLANPFEREAGFRASTQWKQIQQWGRDQKDKRIAVVGRAAAFGQYVFYGPDISNHVQYVADELPSGGSRPIESCVAWRQALNKGRYDYVVITPRLAASAFSAPPEIAWTANDPHVQPVVQAGPAAVFKLNGPRPELAAPRHGGPQVSGSSLEPPTSRARRARRSCFGALGFGAVRLRGGCCRAGRAPRPASPRSC